MLTNELLFHLHVSYFRSVCAAVTLHFLASFHDFLPGFLTFSLVPLFLFPTSSLSPSPFPSLWCIIIFQSPPSNFPEERGEGITTITINITNARRKRLEKQQALNRWPIARWIPRFRPITREAFSSPLSDRTLRRETPLAGESPSASLGRSGVVTVVRAAGPRVQGRPSLSEEREVPLLFSSFLFRRDSRRSDPFSVDVLIHRSSVLVVGVVVGVFLVIVASTSPYIALFISVISVY